MKSNTSEPTLYAMKGNKPFVAAKRSSAGRPTDSYKLSARMKTILSNDLKSASAHARIGDDSSIQSTNPRRRFQRRGSKSPSMFHSAGHFDIPPSFFESIRQKPIGTGNNNMVLESATGIQKGSERSYLTSLTLTDFSDTMDTENDSDEFAC